MSTRMHDSHVNVLEIIQDVYRTLDRTSRRIDATRTSRAGIICRQLCIHDTQTGSSLQVVVIDGDQRFVATIVSKANRFEITC